jgi:hypothetical protein
MNKDISDEKFHIVLSGDEINHILKAVGTATSMWAKRSCPSHINIDDLGSACDKIAHSIDNQVKHDHSAISEIEELKMVKGMLEAEVDRLTGIEIEAGRTATLKVLTEIESGLSTYEKEHENKQVVDACCGMYVPINVVRRLIAVRKPCDQEPEK